MGAVSKRPLPWCLENVARGVRMAWRMGAVSNCPRGRFQKQKRPCVKYAMTRRERGAGGCLAVLNHVKKYSRGSSYRPFYQKPYIGKPIRGG